LRGEATTRAWGAYARLPHTFEEYLTGLSPRRRKKARLILNRIAKQHHMCFRTAETEAEVVEGISWMIRQKRERMHRLGRWTWLDDPRYLPFLQDYTVAAFRKDRLRLYLLQLDDNIAACMLVLLAGNTAVFDADAYDEKYEAEKVSDAVQLLSTRACIEAGFQIMDLGQALQPHKTHYAKEREAVIEMEFYRNQPRSLVCEAASHLAAPLWHVTRNLLPGGLRAAIVCRVKRDATPGTRPKQPCE
jgi:CelD/BcsL family acetyltransferase involved in cellulose biosynthesis